MGGRRATCGEISESVCHDIHQHEYGEQGDPLTFQLFNLAAHNAFQTVKQSFLPEEILFAFLDDIYVVSQLRRIREVDDMLEAALQEKVSIRLHSGKTRVWNKTGVHPPDIDESGPEVWCKGRRENSGHSCGFEKLRVNCHGRAH